MLAIASLIAMTSFGLLMFRYAAYRRVAGSLRQMHSLREDYKALAAENDRLEAENRILQEEVLRTINLYEITRDMCTSLDQEKIFSCFKEGLKRFLQAGECLLAKGAELPKADDDSVIEELLMHSGSFAYLRCEKIRPEDRPIFHILSQQFLLAIRRAILYEQVQGLIVTDGLTRTLSRRYFLERFKEEFERSRTFKLNLSFLMIDIDHFKEFNDQYGHLVGDAVLRKVSIILKDKIRQMDFIGRYGGEEICIALVETDEASALMAAERIRRAIEDELLEVYDEQIKATISIGVASFTENIATEQELLERADAALYRAKHEGRNRVAVYKD